MCLFGLNEAQDELGSGLFSNAVAVVGAVPQYPDDIFVKRYYEAVSALCGACFDVGKKITYKFASFHAEGNE